jgi:predicted dehydrogenase
VAIVGCGKIADAHVAQIQRVPGSAVVAACDRERLMAGQLCERFGIAGAYTDLEELLEESRPEVVHITTPPTSHFDLASRCLERGCHVYVEKPFTVHLVEAQALVALAERRGLKLTVGHDDQFSHVARRLRDLVREGYLGGAPVHMESTYGYDLSAPGYARALLGDRDHWVRKLPGRLLQNIISHGIARIAEFFPSDAPRVMAHGFVGPGLAGLAEREIVDELRVILSDGVQTTAYFTFSSQMRPLLHQFRIYGPKNGLALDSDQETLVMLRGARLPSYAEKFVPPVTLAQQYVANGARNVRLFLRRDFHMKSGMKYLIDAFYRAIVAAAPVPIPYREILLTSSIMESIFTQLGSGTAQPPVHAPAGVDARVR